MSYESYKKGAEVQNKRRSERDEKIVKEEIEIKVKDIIQNQSEGWAFIPGFDGKYQASIDGKIRCLPHVYRTKKGTLVYNLNVYEVIPSINKGYLRTALTTYNSKTYYKGTHRWVMLAFYGESELQVDHINGIKSDNRLSNLRYVNSSDNVNNVKKLNPNKYSSKLFGVHLHKGRWISNITINSVCYNLGSYGSDVDAHNKYLLAKSNWENKGILPELHISERKTSKHKGIGFHKVSSKWRVRYDRVYIGLFLSEAIATKVYSIVEFLVERFNADLSKDLIQKIKNKYGTL